TDARAEDALHRLDASLVRGLGLPADSLGICCRVPGGTVDAETLAAARLELAVVGRVLLSVQHVLEPRVKCAMRLHRGWPAGRVADSRAAVRRSGRVAGVRGVRAGAAVG